LIASKYAIVMIMIKVTD